MAVGTHPSPLYRPHAWPASRHQPLCTVAEPLFFAVVNHGPDRDTVTLSTESVVDRHKPTTQFVTWLSVRL